MARAKPFGRPTKYKKEYCQKLVEHMGKGMAFESFAAKVDTTISTLYEWRKTHPDFSEAYQKGQSKSFEVWEKMGMSAMISGSKFLTSIYIYNMRCRFKRTEFIPDTKAQEEEGGSGKGSFDGFDI